MSSMEELADVVIREIKLYGRERKVTELLANYSLTLTAAVRREDADWFLNWCDRAGIRVEESNIRQGIAALDVK